MSNIQKIQISLLLVVVVILVGIAGYAFIEGYAFVDALYMTVITVATVGFREVRDLSEPGKVFTVFLIISSLGTFFYALSVITTNFIEGELGYYIRDYRKKSGIKKMENHVIVCGFGRNGKQAAEELLAHKHPFVVIEQKHDVIAMHNDKRYNFIEGDATEDETLLKAGVKSAKAMITTLPIDADNLFLVLTGRSINPNMIIVSRASTESTARKLHVAGVNSVVLPEKVGGAHMATLVVKPDIVEFLNHISVHGIAETNLEEILCDKLPDNFQNQSISELQIRKKTGANIIGFKAPDGKYVINPSPDTKMIPDSKIFVLGTPEQISEMKKIFKQS